MNSNLLQSSYAIGVDGGGTKTDLILVRDDGETVAREQVAGTSPSYLSHEEISDVLEEGRERLLSQIPEAADHLSFSLLCMAGNPRFWTEFAGSRKGWGQVSTASDASPVLRLAAHRRPGLVLHSGTGSFIAARGIDGKEVYAGGLGVVFGDPGSAQDIGRRGFAKGLLQIQGWYPRTLLAEALEKSSGKTEYREVLAYFYDKDKPRRYLANFAREILHCAREGDFSARDAITESVIPLVDLARAVSRQTGLTDHPDLPFYVSGPILRDPLVQQIITSQVERENVSREIRPLSASPIEGVRQLILDRWPSERPKGN